MENKKSLLSNKAREMKTYFHFRASDDNKEVATDLFLNSIFFVSLIFLDQVSKYLIRFFGGFYLCNPEIAWNIKIPISVFWIIWICIIFFVVYLIWKNLTKEKPNKMFLISLLLILSGAIGNLIDRITFGCIIDFIDLHVWPVFNLADSFITIGAILVVIYNFQFSIFKK
jgi:signal peptidase II